MRGAGIVGALRANAFVEAAGQQLVDAMSTRVVISRVELVAGHQYVHDSVRTPILGVTEILKNVGLIDDYWWAEEHAERGRRVHKMARQVVNDEVDSTRHSPSPHGYQQSLRIWQGDEAPVTLATELLVYHAQSGYAGTLDWLIVWREAIWVVDFKTGAEAKWHRLQTAGYAAALLSVPAAFPSIRRAALYLHEDGKPATLRVHYDPADHAYFKAALAVEAFKR